MEHSSTTPYCKELLYELPLYIDYKLSYLLDIITLTDMLNKFRQHFLRKSLWLVVLFGSLAMQSENLFACGLMDSGPQTTCCCDQDMDKGCLMGGGCDTADNDVVLSTGCCEISTQVNVGLQTLAVPDSHQNLQVAVLEAPQPPPAPVALIPTAYNSARTIHSLNKTGFTSALPSYGSLTYLITQRFRI